jgi:hypothetical protein
MKKIILILVVVSLGVIGNFLPDSERVKAEPKVVAEEVVVELTEAEKAQEKVEFKQRMRYNECYGAMTIAHKKNGLQERNRSQAIKIREQVCTLVKTDATITGWNTVWTEVK